MPEDAPFVDLGFARVDVDRRRRTGFPEVIFGQGKTPAEVARIAAVILEREPILLATRVTREQFEAVEAEFPTAVFHERARCLTIEREPLPHCTRPVIAVPTSTGYGASFGGLAALLGMLNSCGSGVTVVNIDNGFGAAYAAATINRLASSGVARPDGPGNR